MQMHRPFALVTPTVDGDVLLALARAEAWFTPPQLHRVLSRHSEDGVRRVLHRLAEQGIVERQRVGRAETFRLNREHLAAPHVIGLAELEGALVASLTRLLAEWQPACRYAALFGSAATGSMKPESDLDVFVVRPDNVDADDPAWRAQRDELEERTTMWTGNDARVFEMSEQEVREASTRQERVLRDIASQGITLWGLATFLPHGRSDVQDHAL